MFVVVTSTGETLDSDVDPRFGRARTFILYDTETGTHKVIDNSAGVNAAHGAGTRAAEEVSRAGAEYVITGRCGPKAERALQAAGVKIVLGATGTVVDAIASFQSGAIQSVGGGDVQGG